MNPLLKPKIYTPLFKKRVKHHWALMNPFSSEGLLILQPQHYLLLKEVDGYKNMRKLYYIAKNTYNMRISEIDIFFEKLRFHKIIYLKDKVKEVFNEKALKDEKNNVFSVWIALTNQCNFRCTYCFVHKTVHTMSKNTLEQVLRKVFKTAHTHNFRKVKLILAGGEPLLIKESIYVVHAFLSKQKKGIRTEVGIITNGSLLDDDTCAQLSKLHIGVGISIDGIDRQANKNRIHKRGISTYDIALKSLRTAKKYNVLTNVLITVTSSNVKSLPTFVNYIHKHVQTNIAFSFYKGNKSSLHYLYPSFEDLMRAFKKIYIQSYRDNKSNTPISKYITIDGLRIYPPMPLIHFCGAGSSFITINHQGYLSPCPAYESQVGDIQSKVDLLIQVFQNSPEEYVSTQPKILDFPSRCNVCMWKYACSGGCPTERKYIDTTLQKQTTYCDFYKSIIPFVLKCEAERMIVKHITHE